MDNEDVIKKQKLLLRKMLPLCEGENFVRHGGCRQSAASIDTRFLVVTQHDHGVLY
jgi:hypothetical protein